MAENTPEAGQHTPLLGITRQELDAELQYGGEVLVPLCNETIENEGDESCRELLMGQVSELFVMLDIAPEQWYRYVRGAYGLHDATGVSAEVFKQARQARQACGEWLHEQTWERLPTSVEDYSDATEFHLSLILPGRLQLTLTGYGDSWHEVNGKNFTPAWRLSFEAVLRQSNPYSDE